VKLNGVSVHVCKLDTRRRGDRLWSMPCKVYVPCSLSLKNKVAAEARAWEMSQAEFVLMLLEFALLSPAFVAGAVLVWRQKKEVESWT
jgi:hypothetical protein